MRFLGGVSGATASVAANAGTLVLGNTGFLGGRVTPGAAATLDMRGGSFTIGSLAGSGTVTNNSTSLVTNAAGTLTFGADGTNTTFSGVVTNFDNALLGAVTGMPLNLTKIGTGTTTLTGVSNTIDTGTFTVSQGGLAVSGSGAFAFNALTVNAGGGIVLNNAATALNNRLGGSTLVGSGSARGAVTLNGGSLGVVGNAATLVSETVATLTLGSGGSLLTLDAAGTPGVAVAVGTLGAQVGQGSLLIRGVDGTAGAGIGTLTATSGITASTAGTRTMTIRPDILVDPSPTGVGTGFAVRVGNNVRAIAAGELSSVVGADGTTANYGLSTLQSAWGSQAVNSLTLNSGGGVSGTLDSQLTVSSGGILAFAGNAGLGLGRVTTGAVTAVFHTLGTGTLSLDGSVIGSTAGIVKAGDGTLVFNRRQYYTDTAGTNGTTINGGTLRLAAGDNTILVRTTLAAATPTLIGLFANGGRLDLNGSTQLVEREQSVGTLPGKGGVIAGAAGSRLVSSFATVSSTFAGTITGAVEFQKAGSGVLTLTNGHDTTGAVIVRGGGLTLRDSGSFSATSSVTVNQATLTLDDTGLSANTSRLGSAPITLLGGMLQIQSRQSTQNTYTLPSIALAGGQSTLALTLPSGAATNGSSMDVVVSSLSRTADSVLTSLTRTRRSASRAPVRGSRSPARRTPTTSSAGGRPCFETPP